MLRNDFAHADGKRCASVTSTGGWLDLNTRKLIAPPDALRKAMEALPKVEGFLELRSSVSR
jgi:acyl-CoA thioester hydrolase